MRMLSMSTSPAFLEKFFLNELDMEVNTHG